MALCSVAERVTKAPAWYFWVIEEDEQVEYKVLISFNWKIGIAFDIFRNGEPLFLTEV